MLDFVLIVIIIHLGLTAYVSAVLVISQISDVIRHQQIPLSVAEAAFNQTTAYFRFVIITFSLNLSAKNFEAIIKKGYGAETLLAMLASLGVFGPPIVLLATQRPLGILAGIFIIMLDVYYGRFLYQNYQRFIQQVYQ